jgi:hypothetical protein
MMADSAFAGDMGGGKQSAGAAIPNIGSTADTDVAPAAAGPVLADGEPVSPAVARVRYGAAAAQGYAGDGDPGSP